MSIPARLAAPPPQVTLQGPQAAVCQYACVHELALHCLDS